MAYNPVLPVTYSDASYLSGDELQSDLAVLIGNDIDLNSRINSIAGGYNQTDLSFSGASLSYSGSTYVSGKPVFLTASAVNITGAAGWRYAVCTDAGVISIETIPGGEITADTEQYTPEPVYNSTYNGYYSSVNTAKRIIGICYFDSTNILECIGYGSGKNKNDDWYFTDQAGINIVSANDRFQFTGTWTHTRGTNLTVTDNGAGTTDASGFRITCNRDGWLYIDAGVVYGTTVGVGNTAFTILCNKNAGAFTTVLISTDNSTGAQILETKQFSLRVKARKGDYFTFYTASPGIGGSLYGINIGFEGV